VKFHKIKTLTLNDSHLGLTILFNFPTSSAKDALFSMNCMFLVYC
jgi:hypothetical protein